MPSLKVLWMLKKSWLGGQNEYVSDNLQHQYHSVPYSSTFFDVAP